MKRVLIILCLLGGLVFMAPNGVVGGDEGWYMAAEANTGISAGLEEVTSDEFTAKMGRIAEAIYQDVAKIAPMLTVVFIVIGTVIGIFWREARMSVAWSVLGLLLILWAPQLVGLVVNYANL